MDESLIEKQNGNFANTVLGAVPSVVYNEDCVEGLKRFSDNHFDLAIVDPPYSLNIENSGTMFKKFGIFGTFPDAMAIGANPLNPSSTVALPSSVF